MKRERFLGIGCACLLAIVLAACGSSGSSSGGGGDDDDGGGGSDVIATTAGQVFPIDLVVTSPYAQASAAAALVVKELGDYETERGELQDMIAGTTAAACGFSLTLFTDLGAGPSCYGPELDYTDHPDATPPESGTMPTGDVGIWNELEGAEACAAAQLNHLVDSVGVLVDSAVQIFASAACSLNVNGQSLPLIGQTIDLTSAFQSLVTQNGIAGVTVTAVSLARAANDGDGNAVYDFAFTGEVTDGTNTRAVELFLRHVPLDAQNATYKGKLSFSYAFTDGGGGSQADAGSVLYHKSAATALTYRLQQANYVANPGLTADPLSAVDRDIDPTIIQQDDSTTGWANNFNYALFSLDPQTGAGSYAYAWSAGQNDSNTRAFNATVTSGAAGERSGCAYFGYGPQAKLDTNLGRIDGMICNWAGPNNDHTPQDLVQRQCVEVGTDGVYASAAAPAPKILYAPTNSCDYPGGAFTYASDAGTMTNDVPTATAAFANDLLAIGDMSFTMPTVPSDVY